MSEKNGLRSYDRYLQGDTAAITELVEAYGDELVRFAYCFVKDATVAEDIVEDAFATLLLKRRHFSACDNLRAYLYKTVRNKSVDRLRKDKGTVPLSDVENVLVSGDTERDILQRERNETLYKAIQTLPDQYRETIYLVYFEGYKAEEASVILRKSKKQVYNLLSRARSALKERLNKEGITHEDL